LIHCTLHLSFFQGSETSSQAQHQVKRGLLLNIIVGQGAPVLQLLTSENQTLLVRRNALLVLNLCLDVLNRVRGLYFKGDGLPCK
jgi:hypothetical protein